MMSVGQFRIVIAISSFFLFTIAVDFEKERDLRNQALRFKDAKNFDAAVDKLTDALRSLKTYIDVEKDSKKKTNAITYYAQILHDMGNCLTTAKKYKEAAPVLKEVVSIYLKLFGETHATYSLAVRSLADVYLKLGRSQDALELFVDLEEHVSLGLGKSHEAYIEAANKIGESHYQLGQYQEAVAAYKRITDRTKEFEEKAIGVAEAHLGLSQSLAQIGKYDEALTIAKQAATLFATRSTTNSVDYAVGLNGIAGILTFQGKTKKALKLVDKAYKIVKTLLGESHSMVHDAKNHIQRLQKMISEEERQNFKNEL